MHFLVTPRRRLGVALSKQEVSSATPKRADVHIRETHDEGLGRTTMVASFFPHNQHSPQELPDLVDASVTAMGSLGLNISGIEEVDGAYYFQSWWCRLE